MWILERAKQVSARENHPTRAVDGNTIAFRRFRPQLFSLRKDSYAALICSFCERYTVAFTN